MTNQITTSKTTRTHPTTLRDLADMVEIKKWRKRFEQAEFIRELVEAIGEILQKKEEIERLTGIVVGDANNHAQSTAHFAPAVPDLVSRHALSFDLQSFSEFLNGGFTLVHSAETWTVLLRDGTNLGLEQLVDFGEPGMQILTAIATAIWVAKFIGPERSRFTLPTMNRLSASI